MSEHTWIMSTISDEPITEAKLFGFDRKSDEIVDFLISEQTITPFVIAINGEWGSGKSSLLLTIKNKLERKSKSISEKLKVVYFDAWEYESANPAAALVYKLTKPCENPGSNAALSVGKLALDVIARKTMNMSTEEMKSHFERSITAVESMTERVRDILNSALKDGRLIVLIDDLDRCTIENTLEILNSIKLFLSIKQCIFVVAVDMKKIELAWKTRYGKDTEILQEGTSYLEKIFQIRTSVPTKSIEQMKEYVKSIVIDMPEEVAEIVANTGPKNLRKVKRLLNLALFLSKGGKNNFLKYEIAVIWVIFEYLMKENRRAVIVVKELPKETGNSFIKWIGDSVDTSKLSKFNEFIRGVIPFQKAGGVPSENDELMYKFFKLTKQIIQKNRERYTQMDDSFQDILDAAEDATE